MMCTKNRLTIVMVSVYVLCLFYSCTTLNSETGRGVECRLYWIGDSYPQDIKDTLEADYRMISLNYLIINNTTEEYFLPIKRRISNEKIDSAYQSAVVATINNKAIDTWFSADTRWYGILKPNDSIRAYLKIPEGRLTRVNIKKDIGLKKLIEMLELRYSKCSSDTIYSSKPIPQLRFSKNDTITIHYRDTIIKWRDNL